MNSNSQGLSTQLLTRLVVAALLFPVAANADFALGDSGAPVTIVEYGSLTCGHCVRFHREVMPLITSRHINTGRVRFVYRDFPTSWAATRGAIAARCAGADRYYSMLDALYWNVGDWSRANDVDAALVQHATLLGLDDGTFRACLNDPKYVISIKAAQRQATAEYGVFGTPTFLINDKVLCGIRSIDEIDVLIAEALRRAQHPNAKINQERQKDELIGRCGSPPSP